VRDPEEDGDPLDEEERNFLHAAVQRLHVGLSLGGLGADAWATRVL
jgi:hypothetical protein